MNDPKNQPDFWNSPKPEPTPSAAAPVDADRRQHNRGGRGGSWSSLIMSGLAVIGAIVMPHFAAILAIFSAGSAWNGIRLSTGTPKLGVGALIAAIVVFVAAVIYTIVSYYIFLPSAWENVQ